MKFSVTVFVFCVFASCLRFASKEPEDQQVSWHTDICGSEFTIPVLADSVKKKFALPYLQSTSNCERLT